MGAGFGTLVHAVLEVVDPTTPDLLGELVTRCREQLARQPIAGLDPATLAAGLLPSILTPLGPLAGGLRLADISPRDRLAELDFEFPLAGGDDAGRGPTDGEPAGRQPAGLDARGPRPTGPGPAGPRAAPRPTLGDLAPLLRRHLPADDPLRAYPDVLASPELAAQPLRGYLTGSIDAVLRLPDGRFVVVDYKTNWLGPIGPEGREPLTAAHYTAPLLAAAMIAANYPLQALLYGAALHRFLRWRQPRYAPARHLGGVLYLFIRGMCGPDTPTVGGVPRGVFSWAPPPGLVVELSDLLDRGAP